MTSIVISTGCATSLSAPTSGPDRLAGARRRARVWNGLLVVFLLLPGAAQAEQPLGLKPWITNEIARPSLDNRSRVLEGLDLAPQPPLRSRRLQPVERYAVPRSGRGGLDRSARHRAEQYRSRLRGEVDRLDRGGATDNRHDFDRLQAARRELFRIERELAY